MPSNPGDPLDYWGRTGLLLVADGVPEAIERAPSCCAWGNPAAYKVSTELEYGTKWFGETPLMNTAQWDHAFADGAMLKHGNMGQGIYVDPAGDFCGRCFGLASNNESIAGIDHSPGYLPTAAKMLAGK